jgi:mono/diheme cytochrome c family protein
MSERSRRTARIGVALALAVAWGCSSESVVPASGDRSYLDDGAFRRETLVASLVNPDDGYSQLRLARYDTGTPGDWSLLPQWNPTVDVVASAELDAPGGASPSTPLGPSASSLSIDDAASNGDPAALVRLGEQAFFRYPVQLEPAAATATASRVAFARYGFWTDPARGAGGIVRVRLPDGSRMFAYTCATCHGAPRGGSLVAGVGNDQLDLGRLAVDAAPPDASADWVANSLAWGPGRIDVTTRAGTEPVRIPDLRPVKWLTHLHADATVEQRDLASLAIRIETLIITSNNDTIRPPRVVALAIASYVWSLAGALPDASPQGDAQQKGAAVFASTCSGCHLQPGLTGPPVPLDVVGTDPTEGLSPDRGTGTYRVPSLHGVSTRGALLHDASLPGLSEMFDPARTTAGYAGARRGPGPVRGHPFGLALPDSDRLALLTYLQSI